MQILSSLSILNFASVTENIKTRISLKHNWAAQKRDIERCGGRQGATCVVQLNSNYLVTNHDLKICMFYQMTTILVAMSFCGNMNSSVYDFYTSNQQKSFLIQVISL